MSDLTKHPQTPKIVSVVVAYLRQMLSVSVLKLFPFLELLPGLDFGYQVLALPGALWYYSLYVA